MLLTPRPRELRRSRTGTLHALWHGRHPFLVAAASIDELKLSVLCLQPLVDVPRAFHAAPSALDNRTDPPLRSIDMLNPLVYGDEKVGHPTLQVADLALELSYRGLQGMRLPELQGGALKAV